MDEFDLHKIYDKPAREEVRLKTVSDEVFQPDVILESSSPKHAPIFLEVYHKHKSSPKKLESGQHIIEIRVKDWSEVIDLDNVEIKESERIKFHNFKDRYLPSKEFKEKGEQVAKEFGMKNPDKVLPGCFRSRRGQRGYQDLWRIVVYNDVIVVALNEFKCIFQDVLLGGVVGELLLKPSCGHSGCDEIDAVSFGVDEARRDVLALDLVSGNKDVREGTLAGRGVVTEDAGVVRLVIIIQTQHAKPFRRQCVAHLEACLGFSHATFVTADHDCFCHNTFFWVEHPRRIWQKATTRPSCGK